jgi:hypothetical protein
MTPNRATLPDRSWDSMRFQRGTRGFAAFVTLINGFVTLGLATVVAPSAGLPEPLLSWIVIGGLAAGIVQLAAVIGLVRARRWARSAVAYTAAAGIGTAAFSLLMLTRAGEPVLGAADQTAIGFFVWMIGAWLVASRFVFKAYADPTRRPAVVVTELPAPSLPMPTSVAAARARSSILRPAAVPA